jgi:large subunit ribosomal protein L21
MQAIIKLGSSQYLVSPGQEIIVDRLPQAVSVNFQISQVLLIADGQDIKIGKPYLPDASVSATVVEHTRGEKIRISTFKAKSRYRKTKGFKASLTKLKIGDIQSAQPLKKPVRARVKRTA